MSAVTFDPSRRLDIYFRQARAGEKILTFVDDVADPFDITAIDFELLIKDAFGNTVVTYTEGNGLTIGGADDNELTITFDEDSTDIPTAEYYWQLNNMTDVTTWLNGKAFCHTGIFDGVTETDTITVSVEGDSITITIESGGGGSGDVVTVVAGANISVDATDPANPIVAVAADEALDDARDLDAGIPISGGLTTSARQILAEEANPEADDYTISADDAYKTIYLSKGSAGTLTFPNNTSVPIAVGTWGYARRIGAGQYSFAAGVGVTITTSLGASTDAGLDALFKWTKTATNTFYIDNGLPNTGVPTSRTYAGLDLSANRSVDAVMAALGFPPYKSGRLYGTAANYSAATTGALGASSIRATPFRVYRECTINALVAEVTTVGSFNFRMGIYTDDGTGSYPDDLVVQGTEQDGSTPAAPSLRTATASATLTPGLYWLAIVTAGSITFRADANAAWPTLPLGLDNSSQATIRQPYISVAFTYASLPAQFPGGGAINTNAGSGTNAPIVWVKIA